MSSLFDLADDLAPAAGRQPGPGEHPCRRCGAAACFFVGFGPKPTAWCFSCAPAEFTPGRTAP